VPRLKPKTRKFEKTKTSPKSHGSTTCQILKLLPLWPKCPLELGARGKRERKTEWRYILIAYIKAMNHRKWCEMRYSNPNPNPWNYRVQGLESPGMQWPYGRTGTVWLHYPPLFEDPEHGVTKVTWKWKWKCECGTLWTLIKEFHVITSCNIHWVGYRRIVQKGFHVRDMRNWRFLLDQIV
jgi:hypothetical protein